MFRDVGRREEAVKVLEAEGLNIFRDVGRGEAAVKVLEAEGLNPKFHQLDIADKESVFKLRLVKSNKSKNHYFNNFSYFGFKFLLYFLFLYNNT